MTLGQFHLALAIVALMLGTVVVFMPKGTPIHRLAGFFYASAMIGLNTSALWIYNLTGEFGPFHVLAVISLVTVVIGVYFALMRRPKGRWIAYHAYWISWSYVGLVAAAASEALTRIPQTPFWPAVLAASVVVIGVGGWVINTRIPQILFRDFSDG